MNLALRFPARAFALALLAFVCPALAGAQASLDSIDTHGAFVSGGVIVGVSGMDGDETGRLFVRRPGQAWTEAHPFVRYDANHMATSLFDLEMGTTYDVRAELTDPDGGGTQSLPATLATRPEWTVPPVTRGINVSSDSELADALDSAEPGDHIVVAAGTYTSRIPLSFVSGSPGAPVVVRAQSMSNPPVFTAGAGLYASAWCVLYGLEFVGGAETSEGAIYLRGAHDIEIVGCTLRESSGDVAGRSAIFIAHYDEIPGGGTDFNTLILNNVLIEDDHDEATGGSNNAGPRQTYFGIKQNWAVGGRTIIRGNVIRGFVDGIAPGGDEGGAPLLGPDDPDLLDSWPNRDVDIHDNIIYDIRDDTIETDGHTVNGRIFQNHLGSCQNAISVAPVYPGPYFIVRNTLHGFVEGALKLNTGVAGVTRNVLVYHNTIVERADGYNCIYRGTPTENRDIIFRNNILVGVDRVINTDIGGAACSVYHLNHSFDGDLLWSQTVTPGTGTTIFKWGYSDWADNTHYDTLAAFQSGTAAPGQTFTCPEQAIIGQEPNGIYGDPLLEATLLPGYTADTFVYEFIPAADSPAIDAAMDMPGINDRYAGNGPEIGAAENPLALRNAADAAWPLY